MSARVTQRISPGRPVPRSCAIAAFTLMEILVSAAIVSILLAILATALPKFRERSEGVKCAGNLKNIFQGVNGYLNDNNGIYPPAQLPQPSTLWYHVIEPYIEGAERSTDSVDQPAWLRCPSKRFSGSHRQAVGYGWNYTGFGDELSDPVGKTRLTMVDKPSATILVGDSPDVGAANEWWRNVYVYADSALMARRHGGAGNYLFVDGHIEIFTPENLAKESPRIFQSRKED